MKPEYNTTTCKSDGKCLEKLSITGFSEICPTLLSILFSVVGWAGVEVNLTQNKPRISLQINPKLKKELGFL